MYNPTLGRWMTPDPLAGDITNPQSLNHYAYVLNNPTTLIDPLGLAAGDNACLHNPGSVACGNDVGGARALPPGAGLFGVDGIDLAAAGLLPLGPPSAALPGCGAEFATCVPYSGGPLGFDITGIHDFGGNGLDCAMGEGCESAGITQVTLDSGAAGSGGCPARVLGAVNQTFGTGLTTANLVIPLGRTSSSFLYNGGFNLYLQATNLAPTQFNAIVPGRYPLGVVGAVVGPSLHLPGGGEGGTALFQKSNIGGVLSVLFTAHIDTGFAYSPVGFVVHETVDVLGHATRPPCP